MKVTRKSTITGVVHTLDLPITEEQMQAFLTGTLLQDAFPNLSAADREFILTGVTAEEWNAFVIGPANAAADDDDTPE